MTWHNRFIDLNGRKILHVTSSNYDETASINQMEYSTFFCADGWVRIDFIRRNKRAEIPCSEWRFLLPLLKTKVDYWTINCDSIPDKYFVEFENENEPDRFLLRDG